MDLSAIKQQVMFQIGADAADVQDFLPHLTRYINEGYDRLTMAAYGCHVSEDSQEYPLLTHDRSAPVLPEWTHAAIADFATCWHGSALCGGLRKRAYFARSTQTHGCLPAA